MDFNKAYIENKDISLDVILTELDKDHDNVEDIRENLPMYLRWAKRFDDLKKLFSHTKYGEMAKSELSMYEWLEKAREEEEKKEATMIETFPFIGPLNILCRKIWWICRLSYPYKSLHVKNSNMMISGDGFGMAYFYFASKEDIKVIKIADPEMKSVFKKYQMCEGKIISIDILEQAMEEFTKKVNDKMTGVGFKIPEKRNKS